MMPTTITVDAETLTDLAVIYARQAGYDPAPDQLDNLRRVLDLLDQAGRFDLAARVAGENGALLRSVCREVPCDDCGRPVAIYRPEDGHDTRWRCGRCAGTPLAIPAT